MAKHLKELHDTVQVKKKLNLTFGDGMRCLMWLSEAHPEVFKEFVAVNEVYNKANERDEDYDFPVESEA